MYSSLCLKRARERGVDALSMNGKAEMNGHAATNGQLPASKEEKKPNILQRVANKIIWFFETGFEK